MGRSRGQEIEATLANMVKPCLYQKYKKLAGHGGTHLQSQLLWRPRQDNRLNPGGRGCSEQRSHYCTPAWRESEAEDGHSIIQLLRVAQSTMPNNTVMCCLMRVMRSEKGVVGQFGCCGNIIQSTYTNLSGTAYCTPRLYGIAYCSQATNLYSTSLC